MMPMPTNLKTERGLVGVSVSFMSERQWTNEAEDYVSCMTALVRHIISDSSRRVVIVPNQTDIPGGRDDIAVARDVLLGAGGDRVSLFDVRAHGALAMKAALAKCEVVISCRYHASVAALSSGVPALVIGWHEKYVELMRSYRQDAWLVPNGEAASKILCERFDGLWATRGEIRAALSDARKEVAAAVVESLDRAFG
jgi:polysaccharide pyruvyl transferase WcaK-like protein